MVSRDFAYLGGNEHIFSLDDAFIDLRSNRIANVYFIAVQESCVYVPVSSIDSIFNSALSFIRCCLKCSQADGWHLVAIVQP